MSAYEVGILALWIPWSMNMALDIHVYSSLGSPFWR